MGYTVNEMIKPQTDWLTHVADVKRVGYGEKAAFRTKLEGVTAFIQAKGATPARSKIAHKQVTLDTIAVSARPVINVYELRTGRVQMADLIRDASYEMHVKQIQYIQQVLNAAATNWESPVLRDRLRHRQDGAESADPALDAHGRGDGAGRHRHHLQAGRPDGLYRRHEHAAVCARPSLKR